MRGILNHFPADIPGPFPERAGNVTIMVDPRFRRKGIGSKLLAEAMRRWHIDLANQDYTPLGWAFVQRWRGMLAANVADPGQESLHF